MRLTRRVFLSSTVALLPFDLRAATPPHRDAFLKLTAAKADCRIMPAPAPMTAAIGFTAQVPGPLLRYKKGDEIRIRLVNALDQPVTFSCQGPFPAPLA